MARVELRDVSKVYDKGVIAVNRANISIRDKEFVVLVGPSGCGKSTTLRMVAGLEEVSSGEIFIGERMVNEVPPKDRDIAMVFQNYALYPHMTVFENMAFGLKLRKYPKAEIEARVREAAKILDIEQLLTRKPKALSGGQRQRVAVGRAIVRKPQVFLFDEPLSNLDAKLRVQTRIEISKLHRRLETTMIYVTHDQIEAMTMGDRIVVMKDGLVQQIDTPLNLYHVPQNKFVAGFIGSPAMNILPGKTGQGGFVADGGAVLPMPSGSKNGAGYYGIRPEHMRLAGDDGIAATVQIVEPTGSETQVMVRIGETPLTCAFRERITAGPGETIRILPDMPLVHLFAEGSGQRLSA